MSRCEGSYELRGNDGVEDAEGTMIRCEGSYELRGNDGVWDARGQ